MISVWVGSSWQSRARVACDSSSKPRTTVYRNTSARVYFKSHEGHRVRYNLAREANPPSTEGEEQQGLGPSNDLSDVSSSQTTMFKAVGILSGLGMLETGYLGLMSLLNQSVVCPVAGDTASCNTILGSEYAMLWDTIPLSVLGSITYGAVAVSAWWGLTSENATGVLQKKLVMAGSALLLSTSAYLAYILATVFPGDVCPWCLASISLSLGIAASIVANTKQQELEDQAMPGASLMAAAILFLSLSLGNPDASEAGSRITRLDYKEPVITNQSSDRALALVARLRADGAKMFGAFWCGHCYEQKQDFGSRAMEDFPYVECFPDGWAQGVSMASACKEAGLNGFPTWIIGDEKLEGEQSFDRLEAALDALEGVQK